MDQNQLIQACLQNDRKAQKQLYDQYKSAMYTIVYRITGDFELANDVLQEAFLKVFRGLNSFRGDSTIGAWIKTICIRTAYTKIKKEKHFEELDERHANTMIDWGSHIDVGYLHKAINSLPDGYRAAFVMIEVEGYSHKEAAEILQVTTGTTKSQLFYAKKKLREILDPIIKQ